MAENKLCECGKCGLEVKVGNRFINGHGAIRKHSEEENRKNSLSNARSNIGRIPWNKGLTKEKDIRVCCAAASKETRKRNRRATLRQRHPSWLESQVEEHAIELETEKESRLCSCNCGKLAKPGNKFIYGHQRRGIPGWSKGKTKETDQRLASGKYGHPQSDKTKHVLSVYRTGSKHTEKEIATMRAGQRKAFELNGAEIITRRMQNSGKHKFPYVFPNGSIRKMRSSWEVLYAKYLDSLNIKWLYEPKQFQLSSGKRYWPDFYLPELNEYHEIKGYMRYGDKEKMLLFQKEYPEIALKILLRYDLVQLKVLEK